MANRSSLTIIQLNDSHAYFDLHQKIFWQAAECARKVELLFRSNLKGDNL